MPVPIENDVAVGRLPAGLEATAYFVVAEALTNVAKHAHATSVRLTVTQLGDQLLITVFDNGVGGADATGIGLAGLAGRIGSVDGELSIDSPVGGPTTIAARLPCGW